jgi:hypothetical protein
MGTRTPSARATSEADSDWDSGDAIPKTGADKAIGWGSDLNNRRV